jgi:hypothetical protein
VAEATSAYSNANLQAEVGEYLGFGRTVATWTGDYAYMLEKVNSVIKSGVNQACDPPPINDGEPPHVFSFLTIWGTLTTTAAYSTGTIAVTNGSATVTLTGGTFPSGAAGMVVIIRGRPYEISTRDSGTQLTLAQNFPGDSGTGLTYSVAQWDYDLPDNFGHFAGPIHFAPNTNEPRITVTGEHVILSARQQASYGGEPYLVCARPSTTAPSTAGQRFIASFDRPFTSAQLLTYRYRILPDALTSSNYPYGGAAFGELILASCLAVAERRYKSHETDQRAFFQERLAAAIRFDSERAADTLGYCGDGGKGPFYANDPLIEGERTYDFNFNFGNS